jgi:hypothetical protein
MATRTQQDLAQRVMELLGLLEAQEEVSTEDAALIRRIYENRFEEWFFRDIAYWQIDVIPALAFESLAEMMAQEAAQSFGRSVPIVMDENGAQVAIGVKGLRGMRRIIQVERSGLPTVGTYF